MTACNEDINSCSNSNISCNRIVEIVMRIELVIVIVDLVINSNI